MGRKKIVDTGSIDMIQVARWFYFDRLSKAEIAANLSSTRNVKIDPRTVTNVLDRALKTGMVKILIQETAEGDPLERLLIEAYPHLRKVLILPRSGKIVRREDYMEVLRQFAHAAASYLEDFIKDWESPRPLTVAVGGGETVTEMISALRPQSRPNVRVRVPTLVGHGFLGPKATHLSPSHNALLIWRRLGSIPGAVGFATTPPLPRHLDRLNASLRELSENPDIADSLRDMDKIDIVFAGIGAVDARGALAPLRNSLTMTSLVEHLVKPETLIKMGAVADFSYQFIDSEGRSIKSPQAPQEDLQFFLGAGYLNGKSSLDFFRNMVKRGKDVVVIGGPHKIEALLAALRGRLFSTLITDEVSARDILSRSHVA